MSQKVIILLYPKRVLTDAQRFQKGGVQNRPASPSGSLRYPEESWIDWGSFFQEERGE